MSGRLTMDSKAIVNRMSSRQFGRAIILEAGLSMRVQPMTGSLLMRVQPVSGSLLVRIKTLLPALLFCV